MKIALTHRSALEALSVLATRSDVGNFPRTSLPAGFVSNAGAAQIECLQLSLIHISEPTRPY